MRYVNMPIAVQSDVRQTALRNIFILAEDPKDLKTARDWVEHVTTHARSVGYKFDPLLLQVTGTSLSGNKGNKFYPCIGPALNVGSNDRVSKNANETKTNVAGSGVPPNPWKVPDVRRVERSAEQTVDYMLGFCFSSDISNIDSYEKPGTMWGKGNNFYFDPFVVYAAKRSKFNTTQTEWLNRFSRNGNSTTRDLKRYTGVYLSYLNMYARPPDRDPAYVYYDSMHYNPSAALPETGLTLVTTVSASSETEEVKNSRSYDHRQYTRNSFTVSDSAAIVEAEQSLIGTEKLCLETTEEDDPAFECKVAVMALHENDSRSLIVLRSGVDFTANNVEVQTEPTLNLLHDRMLSTFSGDLLMNLGGTGAEK